MARRKKNEGLVDIMVTLPWWISVATGMAAYIACRWIIPATLPPALVGIGPALVSLAWMPFAMFCFLGFIAFARTALDAKPAATQQPASAAGYRRTEPAIKSGANAAEHAWGRNSHPAANAANPPAPAPVPARVDTWTLETLRSLEWKRFELLCGKYYEAAGFTTTAVPFGPDGGIDVKLFRNDPTTPIALVQCKAWNSGYVGVAIARELLGVMTAEQVQRGILITTGNFSPEAEAFAKPNRIQLLSGEAFLQKILDLPSAAQAALLAFAFEGDYVTPSCPSCGIKMLLRKGKTRDFFGCKNYPKCKNKLQIRA